MGVVAVIAARLHGIENEMPLEPGLVGDACTSDAPRVPGRLREAAELFAAFGQEIVGHYANAARVELAAFDAAVTDWERRRGFERL